MCGRFSFASPKEKISKQFGISIEQPLKVSYNIAPTHHAYVITNDKPNELQRFTWGLIPHWARDAKIGHNLINARSETVSGKPSFRMPVRKHRCLVLADGFYEWKKIGREKIPHRITMKDHSVIAMAGIFDVWQTPQGDLVHSFSILTTTPNEDMKEIHNRMPVIFPNKELQTTWLEETRLEYILSLLQPMESGYLNVYPVSNKVNKPTYNERDLYNQVKLPPTLF